MTPGRWVRLLLVMVLVVAVALLAVFVLGSGPGCSTRRPGAQPANSCDPQR